MLCNTAVATMTDSTFDSLIFIPTDKIGNLRLYTPKFLSIQFLVLIIDSLYNYSDRVKAIDNFVNRNGQIGYPLSPLSKLSPISPHSNLPRIAELLKMFES